MSRGSPARSSPSYFPDRSSIVSKKRVFPRKNSTVQSDPPAQSQDTPPPLPRHAQDGLPWTPAAHHIRLRACRAGATLPVAGAPLGCSVLRVSGPALTAFGCCSCRFCGGLVAVLVYLVFFFACSAARGTPRLGVSCDLFWIVSRLRPLSACPRRPISFCSALRHWLPWSTAWLLSSFSSLSGRSTSGVDAGARA